MTDSIDKDILYWKTVYDWYGLYTIEELKKDLQESRERLLEDPSSVDLRDRVSMLQDTIAMKGKSY